MKASELEAVGWGELEDRWVNEPVYLNSIKIADHFNKLIAVIQDQEIEIEWLRKSIDALRG